MAGALTFSMIADAIGRRNAMVFAALLFGSFTYLISFSTNLWELSAYRFCASFGVGGAMPMAIALISDYTPTKRRGLMITGLFLGYSIGSAGGGFLAAELIVAYGWQSVFQVGGIVAVDPDLGGDRDLVERFAAIEHAEHRVLHGRDVEFAAFLEKHGDM